MFCWLWLMWSLKIGNGCNKAVVKGFVLHHFHRPALVKVCFLSVRLALRLSVLLCCTHTFCLSCLSLSVIPHPPNSWNRVSLVTPAPPPPFVPAHAFFLFLVLVKSGMARVFHHRNRHNRPTQPSTGSANRDQIKSIIQPVCVKAFFLPLALLQALMPYFRAVPAGRGGRGGRWRKFWTQTSFGKWSAAGNKHFNVQGKQWENHLTLWNVLQMNLHTTQAGDSCLRGRVPHRSHYLLQHFWCRLKILILIKSSKAAAMESKSSKTRCKAVPLQLPAHRRN